MILRVAPFFGGGGGVHCNIICSIPSEFLPIPSQHSEFQTKAAGLPGHKAQVVVSGVCNKIN